VVFASGIAIVYIIFRRDIAQPSGASLITYSFTRTSCLRDPERFGHEDFIHVFKTPSRSLRIEQPSDRHEARIESSPNQIQLVAKAIDRLRSDVYDDEIGKPVKRDTKSNALVARTERHDLRSIHPRHRQDAKGERVEEEECEADKDPLRLLWD